MSVTGKARAVNGFLPGRDPCQSSYCIRALFFDSGSTRTLVSHILGGWRPAGCRWITHAKESVENYWYSVHIYGDPALRLRVVIGQGSVHMRHACATIMGGPGWTSHKIMEHKALW